MLQNPVLLPAPQHLTLTGDTHALGDQRLILLAGANPSLLRFSSKRFQRTLRNRLSYCWEAVASQATPPELVGITLKVAPECALPAQGYTLSITREKIDVEALDAQGIFYAICTLIQLIEQYGPQLPCLQISDWPDYPARGVMLDVSRDKVPTMETLYSLVDMLAGWKINQLQLYTEHAFAYRQHSEVWAKATPLSGQEILELDDYCRERYIELVPNQNSFGHMSRWLVHPRYAPLSEVTTGFETPWGHLDGPFSLCPTDPASLDFVFGLYDELLPHFSSRIINVGCDETFDLGQGRSKEACAQQGEGPVYLDYLLKIYREVKRRGYTMQFWGDIILRHPELIASLPKDVIAMEWGYEANHPFETNCSRFAAAGIPFYVCPGTSSWNSIAGRSDNALGNLLHAAESGRKHGAIGYLITDWGDNGHWQAFPVSDLGFAAGAAYAWGLEANRLLDIPEVLSRYAFRDRAQVMGCVAYELGNIYKSAGIDFANTSVLFYILQQPLEKLRTKAYLKPIDFQKVLEDIDQAIAPLKGAEMERPDGELIRAEYELMARMLRHACRRGVLAVDGGALEDKGSLFEELDRDLQEIEEEYRRIWLLRNRWGGLEDSVMRFEKARKDYGRAAIHELVSRINE